VQLAAEPVEKLEICSSCEVSSIGVGALIYTHTWEGCPSTHAVLHAKTIHHIVSAWASFSCLTVGILSQIFLNSNHAGKKNLEFHHWIILGGILFPRMTEEFFPEVMQIQYESAPATYSGVRTQRVLAFTSSWIRSSAPALN
jgi:hypothetical protein